MEAELKFEREEKEGVAVVGTYLIDASRRLGVTISTDCGRLGLCDSCAVTVKQGAEFLTAPTKAENEQLKEERLQKGERLACQAKIEQEGEIVILTPEKKEEPVIDKAEEYRDRFAELPLEEKIAQLVKLEAITLGETFNFILNSPYKIVGLGMDILAQFGLKLEDEAKNATKPEEHRDEPVTAETVAVETPNETDLETPIPAEENNASDNEIVEEMETAEAVEDNPQTDVEAEIKDENPTFDVETASTEQENTGNSETKE
ncbi:MAG TPA: 2Fe-2S iron-sulfur cluster-binding protein [Pyrinomonadaceae bacterium]|nr:2Fe-2S iron-sulfur cluster-binding protein [Pyrinomonadaceae bacterium]